MASLSSSRPGCALTTKLRRTALHVSFLRVAHQQLYRERKLATVFFRSFHPFFMGEIFVANIIQDKRGNIEIDQIESRRRKYRFGIFLDYATKAYQFSPLLVLLLPLLFQDTVDRPSYLSIRKQQRGTSSLSLFLSLLITNRTVSALPFLSLEKAGVFD